MSDHQPAPPPDEPTREEPTSEQDEIPDLRWPTDPSSYLRPEAPDPPPPTTHRPRPEPEPTVEREPDASLRGTHIAWARVLRVADPVPADDTSPRPAESLFGTAVTREPVPEAPVAQPPEPAPVVTELPEAPVPQPPPEPPPPVVAVRPPRPPKPEADRGLEDLYEEVSKSSALGRLVAVVITLGLGWALAVAFVTWLVARLIGS